MKQTMCVLSLVGFGVIAAPANVLAQCIQTDVSVQGTISGSKTPTPQQSNVRMGTSSSCTGTYVRTGGTQIRVGGTQPGQQTREIDQQINGSSNRSGVDGTTVQIRVNPTVDVYNPADRL